MIDADLLVVHASPLVTGGEETGPKAGAAMLDLGEIRDGALAVVDGKVAWVGRSTAAAQAVRLRPGGTRLDATGLLVAPGFVDPHTHFLHAGSREDEFALRLAGRTYLEIAAAGGGIKSTVKATRGADDATLERLLERRLDRSLLDGTTTVEVKVSYGLNVDEDLRGLEIVGRVASRHPVRVIPTWMGAHEFPEEYQDRREEYVDELVRRTPEVARQGIARFVDVFCEEGVFTPAQARRVLEAARGAGLGLKVHADEFGPSGGSRVAAEMAVTSADHLHGAPPESLEPMRAAGVVPVLLPGTAFFLRMKQFAPARAMVEAGLPIALATDSNPGSCTTESMPLIMTIGCLQLGLQPEEAFTAATVNAAAALGLAAEAGRLSPGQAADFQLLEAPGVRYLAYHFGRPHLRAVYRAGVRVVEDGRRCGPAGD